MFLQEDYNYKRVNAFNAVEVAITCMYTHAVHTTGLSFLAGGEGAHPYACYARYGAKRTAACTMVDPL